jgi:hypothetical protein
MLRGRPAFCHIVLPYRRLDSTRFNAVAHTTPRRMPIPVSFSPCFITNPVTFAVSAPSASRTNIACSANYVFRDHPIYADARKH